MKKALIAVALLSASAMANATSFAFYDNRAAWESALLNWNTETFDDATLNAGLTLTSNNPYYTSGVSGGVWNDRLQEGTTTTMTFNGPILALGGDWNLAVPGGPGTGIASTIELFLSSATESVSQQISRDLNGFWGFIVQPSTSLFDVFRMTIGSYSGAWAETYTLDNLSYTANVNAVPLPAAAWLFGSALLGMGALRRKQKVEAAAA